MTIEVNAIEKLKQFVDENFLDCIDLIHNSKGRVVITGIGKSANIANKIVSTLNSTGTPSIFMHAADAIHGDLGIIQKDDVVICISKSGNTPEIKILIPLLKRSGNRLIAIVGNLDSYLALHADYVIDTTVEREACPNNLAPTASTTAQLVMGDALAVCLLEKKGFSKDDFARYHPGGALGKRLYLTVGDLSVHNACPKVDRDAGIRQIIMEISSNRLGATAVVDQAKVIGVITDGDLRRMLQTKDDVSNLTATEIMSPGPKTISEDTLVIEALEIMKQNNITQLLVTAQNDEYSGVIHMHDIIKEGIL
ncbi:MAG: KpsF/GutQ family sugar-phosphate isomerase [Bacteroidales bacterium]|nr:KpsF/GutQ family sugar-phosphate isomerase [Bacteroidales bacterium]